MPSKLNKAVSGPAIDSLINKYSNHLTKLENKKIQRHKNKVTQAERVKSISRELLTFKKEEVLIHKKHQSKGSCFFGAPNHVALVDDIENYSDESIEVNQADQSKDEKKQMTDMMRHHMLVRPGDGIIDWKKIIKAKQNQPNKMTGISMYRKVLPCPIKKKYQKRMFLDEAADHYPKHMKKSDQDHIDEIIQESLKPKPAPISIVPRRNNEIDRVSNLITKLKGVKKELKDKRKSSYSTGYSHKTEAELYEQDFEDEY